jgi:hypothetical protein
MALDVRVPLDLLSPSPYSSHFYGRSEITRCRKRQFSALCAAMNAPMPDALAVIMFLSSLQGHFEATVAAIRFISDHNLTWDDVFSRLIEEASSPRSRTRQDSALAVHSRPICSFCGLQGHEANCFFTNPSNLENRLGSPPMHPSSQCSGPTRCQEMVHAVDQNGPGFPAASRSGGLSNTTA